MAEMDIKQEEEEMSAWEKVSQLAKSGDPSALGQIAQIADQELQAQQAEMQGEETEQGGEAEPSSREKMLAAVKNSMNQ